MLVLAAAIFATMPFTCLGVASIGGLVALRFLHGAATALQTVTTLAVRPAMGMFSDLHGPTPSHRRRPHDLQWRVGLLSISTGAIGLTASAG